MILTILVIAAVIAADVVTKIIVRANLAVDESVTVIPHVVDFTHKENSGAAFSMLTDARWVFIVFSIIAIVGILGYLFVKRPESRLVRVALAMIVGGGIGNMIERLSAKGTVTDFINPTFVNFAVFNVADSCVTVGCFILILWVILDSVREAREKKALASGANGVEPGADAEPSADAEPGAEAKADAEPDAEAKSDAEPDTDTKSDAEPGAEAKADAEPDADGGQDAENDGQ